MANTSLDVAIDQVQRIVGLDSLSGLSDRELVERFTRSRDESAFVALVRRHGPLVRGVCRRVLRHEQDAEDAFQATFLVLARKAGSIRKSESLAGWLHMVAFRIACRARNRAGPLTNRPGLDHAAADGDPAQSAIRRELRDLLDDEIARLPGTQARAIILCYLQGKTHEEAARLLGCPKGTLAAWVARGRDRLCKRLTSRGCTFSAAGLAAACAEFADGAAVSTQSAAGIAQVSLAFLSGEAISPQAVTLAEGALRMTWLSKLKIIAGVLVLVVTLGVGGFLVKNALAGDGNQDGPKVEKKAEPPAKQDAEIAKLRAEIGDLRDKLDEAVKELKSLREAMKAEKATYRGKPASFWLAQLEEADPKFRAEAVDALGALATKNPKLAQPLLEALKNDRSDDVQAHASEALGKLGPEVLPGLIEIAKDKSDTGRRIYAMEAIGDMGSKAEPAVPVLVANLREKAPGPLAVAAVQLGRIGPGAKSALPALVEALGACLEGIEKHDQPMSRFGTSAGYGASYAILDAIERIQPGTRADLPAVSEVIQSGGASTRDYVEAWKKIHETLAKKYLKAK